MNRRTRCALAGLTIAIVAELGGCSGAPAAAPATLPAATPPAATTPPATTPPATTPPPTPTPTIDVIAACTTVIGNGGTTSLLQRIPASLTSIGATITADQLNELLAIDAALDTANTQAPPDLKAAITSLDAPFQQVNDVVKAGGGNLNMDTSHVASDITRVMTLCASAGYKIS